MHAKIPKKRLYIIHFFIAILRPIPLFPSNSSETILVAARFIPELAKVVTNANIDIINSNIPCTFTTKLVCNIYIEKYIY